MSERHKPLFPKMESTGELIRNAEKRVCTKVWEVVSDYRCQFPNSLILRNLASDLEDVLAYGPEKKEEGQC